ncbi:GntR family transcriptional regulator [Marivita sp. S6314]|uniref:GntR family transcriptional regulator n=1 Tax=Marivita sp. S6314 TaxID=2926406 RepID=UPI001FF45B49|nr:GntR family transcriptional regulator [Marivita sp. S6314]MCK0149343.1 GntR family transcriptional regulator [Marivita sp. S6314]
MTHSSLSAKSSGNAAYDALLDLLRSGAISPGDRLREEDVAQQLNLSRTPVREALRKLEAGGIVEHRPRIGAVIRSLSHTEIVELYEMRIVLERTAARMAAQHGSDAEFDTLDAMNREIDTRRDAPSVGAAINQDFHRTLYLAARNRFLLSSAQTINSALLLLGRTTYLDPDRMSVVVDQHNDIITALRNRDGAAAEAAAEAHLQTSLRYRLRGQSR